VTKVKLIYFCMVDGVVSQGWHLKMAKRHLSDLIKDAQIKWI